MFEYKIDGLIYLPAKLPVGANLNKIIEGDIGDAWPLNYKWKPEILNTIDFAVYIDKENKKNKHKINSATINGNIVLYKTLILTNRYKIDKDTTTNFCMKMIKPIQKSIPKRMAFSPKVSNSDVNVSRANIIVKNNKILCENGQEIRDGDFVEMRYDGTKEHNMVWIPLRVRFDKTNENTFDTAMKIWKTIENPITDEMIYGDVDIKTVGKDDNLLENEYYGEKKISILSEPLKLLHNYIKFILITGVGSSKELNKEIQIMDTSIGQGGDINKYFTFYLKCKFLFGLDISNVNEACKRYIKKHIYNEKYQIPAAIFIKYDTSKNIIQKEGIDRHDTYQQNILNSLYNKGVNIDPEYEYIDSIIKGRGVGAKSGGSGNAFDMISCQFSIHYYFKDNESLDGYLQNISENCKTGGYFIGCCYDGKLIFNRLKKSEPFEYIDKNENVIYRIEKEYDMESFDYDEDDETNMLGKSIRVEMESIGKPIEEYLVNFDFFVKKMKDIGFVPELPTMKNKHDIKIPIGSFKNIVDTLNDRNKEDTRFKNYVNSLEILQNDLLLELSMMNKWFIFVKR